MVTAAAQTAGHGRLGRQWQSPPGNFYGSLVVNAAVPMARYGEYSFVTAVALRAAIAAHTRLPVTLKWPNDVLLDGKKCAGILIESGGTQNECLIIGMGVNLRHAPPAETTTYPAAALWPDTPPDAARDSAFLQSLLTYFDRWHARYQSTGFKAIQGEWLRHAHNLNSTITVKTPATIHTGIFSGIDGRGNLRLTVGMDTLTIHTADVGIP